MNSNSRDRNRNLINFPKTKKLTREQSKRDSNLLEKSRIRSISTSNILRGRPPLHAAKSKNHTTQSNPASKHARTQTPRVQCPPPPLETSLNPCPSPPPKSQPLLAPLQAVTKPFHKLVSQRIRGGKKIFFQGKTRLPRIFTPPPSLVYRAQFSETNQSTDPRGTVG